MASRKFPYKAFVLTPSFQVKQVEVVKDSWWANYHETSSGKSYRVDDLHKTKAAAIKAGWTTIGEQRARVEKSSAAIDKRQANLHKAELAS